MPKPDVTYTEAKQSFTPDGNEADGTWALPKSRLSPASDNRMFGCVV